MDRNTRIIDLTLGQLLDEIDKHMGQKKLEERIDPFGEDSGKYIIGVSGLQKYLNCCYNTAKKLLDSGKLSKISFQYGRKLYIDKSKLMDAMSK